MLDLSPQAFKDLDGGIKQIKQLVEERVDDSEYWLPASLLEMAGMSRLTPQHIRENSGPLYGDFTPAAFKGWHRDFEWSALCLTQVFSC